MILAFVSLVTVVPRSFRFRFWSIRDAKCEVPAERCFAFPVAVRRNRFFVPLCVFCLGIFFLTAQVAETAGKPVLYD